MLILDPSRYKREGTETFCLRILSNSLPLWVLPLIQEGELFTLFLKTEEFQNISRIKIYRTGINIIQTASYRFAEILEACLVSMKSKQAFVMY